MVSINLSLWFGAIVSLIYVSTISKMERLEYGTPVMQDTDAIREGDAF